jgi:hypothetical protein
MSVREEIRALAGVDIARLAELERKRIARIDEALDAQETKFFTYQGEVIEERDVIDHTTRLAAATLAGRVTGTDPSKSASDQGKGGPTNVLVQIVTGDEVVREIRGTAEVIDAKPA